MVFRGTNLDAVAPKGQAHPIAFAERDQRICAAQVHLLFRSPLPQLANIINAAILSAVIWDDFPHEALVAWLGLMAAVTLVRFDLWARYKRVQPPPGKARRWRHLYVLWSGLTACLWGLSASSVFIVDSLLSHVFLAFVIGGMGAGAVAANSIYLPALFAYLLPLAVPLALSFLAQGQFLYLAMALMTAMFIVLLSVIGRYFNRSLLSTFNLQIDNEQLIDDLASARDALELRVEERTAKLKEEIAERKRAEEDLLDAKQAVELGSRAKSEFLANMSHELRTPLNAIIAFSEIIKDERFGPSVTAKYRDYANSIHGAGRNLLEIINAILELAKIEIGADELHEEQVNIPELVRSALVLVKEAARSEGVEVKLLCPREPPTLQADARLLKQILVNLLSNGIKFNKPGGTVTLRIRCDEARGYVFEIADTGIGIAAADIPKAFSRFSQVDGKLERKYGGTGLGLPLARTFVELHGGSLDLQSEVGAGTTVMVCFPVERAGQRPRDEWRVSGEDRKAM